MSNPLAGQQDLSSQSDRQILLSKEFYAVGRGVLDKDACYDGKQGTGYNYSLQPGTIMGRITASKKWCPCIRSVVPTSGGATAQAIPVVDARHFKAGMLISVGSDTGKTIASVNYDTNVITVSDTAFAFADGEAVIATHKSAGNAITGAEIPRAILDEYVDLWDNDTRAVRDMGVSKLMYSGVVVAAQILGDDVAIRALTGSSQKLNNIIWDDDIGQD